MSLILSIETSTKVCSVALHQAGLPVAATHFYIEKATAKLVTVAIEEIMANSGHRLADLDAIAVAKGPGSYTGLRIGTATAKGLCFALQKPLVAIGTLEAMAAGVRRFYVGRSHLFCPMIDARRMEVYCALFDDELNLASPVEAKVLDENSFSDFLVDNHVVFFGDGAAKFRPKLLPSPRVSFIDGVWPSALQVGERAYPLFTKAVFEDVETFEPYYLKEFVGTAKTSLT
ncbi:MAG: tRNA (adenosine(37)-N6)-threonylcarbamoyltransferase complex dimerization subunit type 1 TsaB [Cytophagales bacterium]|nr:tRNA (adenosine(37)-N6)-threonylcarbamoyltransferase complex dimerization subunit type 1 TsaB [Cytophagales bacterium]